MHNLAEFAAQNKTAVTARESQTATRDGEWKWFGFGVVMAVQPQGIAEVQVCRVWPEVAEHEYEDCCNSCAVDAAFPLS